MLQAVTSRSNRGSRRGFTLVELLVVIGIIAVLISILLPALGQVRKSAQSLKCASNLRQIGQSINIYVGQNKGILPYGYWSGSTPGGTYDGDRAGDWTTLIGQVIDSKNGASYNTAVGYLAENAGARGTFLCPSAIPGTTKGLLTHYSAHPRLMPSLSQPNYNPAEGSAPAGKTWYYQPYPIAKIKRSTEIALVFDGSQKSASGGVAGQWGANVVATELDSGRIWWSTFLTDNYALDPQWWMVNTFPIDTKAASNSASDWNKDGDGNWSNVRFRHGKNNVANVLFVDGHVGPMRVKNKDDGEIRRSNVNVNFIKSRAAY